jgi:hypothetical protein
MIQHWDDIIEPLLRLRQPACLVEVGADEGITTRKLLEYCRPHHAILHTIDPLPKFDGAAWREQYGECFVLHQTTSVQALPGIDRLEVVLIDGDHNWYTVYHELKLLEQRSTQLAQPFPLVVFHDIGWPYCRRDMYYNPEQIPAEYRQPCARLGVLPGVSALQEHQGLNPHLWHARHEGGPRNGVLTGIEDYLRETSQSLKFINLPGYHGLGILFPWPSVEPDGELARFLATLDLPPHVQHYLAKLERSRVDLYCPLYRMALREMETRSGQAAAPAKPGITL